MQSRGSSFTSTSSSCTKKQLAHGISKSITMSVHSEPDELGDGATASQGESRASRGSADGKMDSNGAGRLIGKSQEGTVVQRIAWADLEDSDES